MALRIRQRLEALVAVLEGFRLYHGLLPTVNGAGGFGISKKYSRPVQHYVLSFTTTITVLAANDYGSVKILDLPNTDLLIVNGLYSLSGTLTGGLVGVSGSAAHFGIGTAAASNTTLATTMQNIVPVTASGGGGAGVISASVGSSSTTEKNLFVAAGASNSIYLNVGTVATATDPSAVVISGYVGLKIIDLGL